jgi:hypothetical protein
VGGDSNVADIVRVWDGETGASLLQLKGHTRPITSVAVLPDGKRAFTASQDRTARVWDIDTGAMLLELRGHLGSVNSVAVSPDGGRIVTASADRTARIWDARSGAELHRFTGHNVGLTDVVVTPDGNRVITGDSDGTVLVWDLQTGVELLQMEVTSPEAGQATRNPISALAASDKRFVAVASGFARLFDFAQLRPRFRFAANELASPEGRQRSFERAKAAVPRCLTIEQRRDFLLSPEPPSWCIALRKYPYESEVWRTPGARDSNIAARFGNYADAAIKEGDFWNALDASERALQIGPDVTWTRINRAHALMFLGRIAEARNEYLGPNRGTKPLPGSDSTWERLVTNDLRKLRDHYYRHHPLMDEILKIFDPPKAAE